MKKKRFDFNDEDINHTSGFLLWQASTLWQRGIKKELDGIGITHPQFVLLSSLIQLSKHQEVITQINLSAHSHTDPMTTSAIIQILQRKNLIERHKHHADTRAKKITLTAEGMEIIQQATKIIEKFDKRFFKLLGKEKSFRGKLLSLLAAKNNKEKH